MEHLAMNEFRRQVGEYINQTYYAGKTFVLTKGEKKVAALVPVETLARLEELETFYEQTIAIQNQAEPTQIDSKQTDEVVR
jgi:prevent-host-death family protein